MQQNHHLIKMDNNTSSGTPMSLLLSGGFYILGILISFQYAITIGVGLTAMIYNLFRILKDNFPNAYERVMLFFGARKSKK
jgi:hypothetical protein